MTRHNFTYPRSLKGSKGMTNDPKLNVVGRYVYTTNQTHTHTHLFTHQHNETVVMIVG